jgi:hypothetical protein
MVALEIAALEMAALEMATREAAALDMAALEMADLSAVAEPETATVAMALLAEHDFPVVRPVDHQAPAVAPQAAAWATACQAIESALMVLEVMESALAGSAPVGSARAEPRVAPLGATVGQTTVREPTALLEMVVEMVAVETAPIQCRTSW